MTLPVITALTASMLLPLQLVLMLSTGLHRGQTKIGVGVGNDRHLERKMRRHGNLSENSAIFLITLGLAELLGAPQFVLFWVAVVFVVARLLHALAFTSLDGSHNVAGNPIFLGMRFIGAMGTLVSGLVASGAIVYAIVN